MLANYTGTEYADFPLLSGSVLLMLLQLSIYEVYLQTERDKKCIVNVSSLYRPLSPMESLNTFESEMEADGQGSYSLFPALDSIASLSGTAETLERLLENNVTLKRVITVSYSQRRLL